MRKTGKGAWLMRMKSILFDDDMDADALPSAMSEASANYYENDDKENDDK